MQDESRDEEEFCDEEKDGSSQEVVNRSRSFRDVVTGYNGNLDGRVAQSMTVEDNVIPLGPIPNPRMEGGNIVVEVDDEFIGKELTISSLVWYEVSVFKKGSFLLLHWILNKNLLQYGRSISSKRFHLEKECIMFFFKMLRIKAQF